MKYLITTIAALVLVGCGPPKAPDISIHGAALIENIEAVKQHLAAGTDVNVKDKYGSVPLDYAASKGQKVIAELLIAKGADVNAKDYKGRAPLHWAAMDNHTEVVELLIDKGANVNSKDRGGRTPLDWAKRHPETAYLLRKHGGKSGAEDSIYVAAWVENIEAVKQHLADGTDLNAKNMEGDTLLHIAARNSRKEIAELLIAEGADVNAKSQDGDTPLDWAIHPENLYETAEIADLLRKHGAKTAEELKAEGK